MAECEKNGCDCLGVDIPVNIKVRVSSDCCCEDTCGEGTPPPSTGSESCRIRVTEDLHVYVNGDLEESGDGLTPETAVMTFGEAVEVINRYDGQGKYSAWVNFASLADGKMYDRVTVTAGSTPTFVWLRLQGEDYTTTRIGYLHTNHEGCRISNLAFGYIVCNNNGLLIIEGRHSVFPHDGGNNCISAQLGGVISVTADILITGTTYNTFMRATYGGIISLSSSCTVRVSGQTFGIFAAVQYNGTITAYTAKFTGTAKGSRYYCVSGGCINAQSETLFPGDKAGLVSPGGIYV